MFGPDSGKASWQGLNLMYERVRVGAQPERRQRADNFLQVDNARSLVKDASQDHSFMCHQASAASA